MNAVDHPKHYTGITVKCANGNEVNLEAIEIIDGILSRSNLPPTQAMCLGNALKYLFRTGHKNLVLDQGTEDIKKAVWYLNHLISLREVCQP